MNKETRLVKVDTLRGISVLAVLLFHFQLLGFDYGYLGVDIFFVVSGYILTLIYGKKISNFRDLYSFYARRLRRLLPLLSLVTTFTVFASAVYFIPTHLLNTAKHSIGAVTFTSNILFWRETNYFDIASHYKPLLHTWSLGLEFQYYICAGIFWLVVGKITKSKLLPLIIILTLLTGISLLGSFYFEDRVNFNFFMLPFRGWQFGLGMLMALAVSRTNFEATVSATVTDVFALGALILVFVGFTFLEHSSVALQFTSCSLAASYLLLRSDNSNSQFSKILSSVGTASYPIYLVHWPIFVIYTYAVFRETTTIERWALLLISVLLGFILSAMYEKNSVLKFSKVHLSRSRLYSAFSAIILFLGAGISIYAMYSEGLPGRFEKSKRQMLASIFDEHNVILTRYQVHKGTVPTSNPTTNVSGGVCVFDPSSELVASLENQENSRETCIENMIRATPINKSWFIIIGDSNGEDFFRSISLAYPDIHFSMLRQSGCAPIADQTCFPQLHARIAKLNQSPKLSGIILASRFVDQNFSALHDVLRAAAKTQVPIALVGPSLVFRHNIGWILVRLSTEKLTAPLTLKLASPAFHPDIAINNQVVSNLAKSNGALFINRVAHFCDDGSCLLQPLNGSVPYIYDTQHLSVTGIEHFAEQLSKNEKLSKFLETDTRR